MLLNPIIISDTSCLRLLSKIGELDLFKKVAGRFTNDMIEFLIEQVGE